MLTILEEHYEDREITSALVDYLDGNRVSSCETGLYAATSDLLLERNIFEDNVHNAAVSDYAYPKFGTDAEYARPGNNVLRHSGYAELCVSGGAPFLGLYEDEEHVIGGFNSVFP